MRSIPSFYPTALQIMRSPNSFDPQDPGNIVTAHLRQIVGSDQPGERDPIDRSAVIEHWVDFIVDLIIQKKDCPIVVTGTPGDGKSTFTYYLCILVRQALNRALRVQEEFNIQRDIVYRLSELIHRTKLSTRDTPSVVQADEGVLVGAQARAGSYDASIILDRVLTVSRIQGVTLFILAPSIWGVASFVRNRRARLWFHVEKRGLSTAFILKDALSFTPPKELPFAKAKAPWAKLHWDSMELDPSWADYEARKIAVTLQTLEDSELEALKMEKKLGLTPPEWAADFEKKVGIGAGGAGGPGSFVCRDCGRQLGNAYNLETHRQTQHAKPRAAR